VIDDQASFQDLTDESGESWPEEVKGWRTVKLGTFKAEAKSTRTWFNLQVNDNNGARASLSQSLFAHPADAGEQTCNRITLGRLKELFVAAGLTKEELPAPNPRAIAQALGKLSDVGTIVDAYLQLDNRGMYLEAVRFRKPKAQAQEAAPGDDAPPF